MDLVDRIKEIGARATLLKDQLKTEEATKNALVMPFIAALGYDVFNPTEVVPEFTADVGTKKGEKVDYAIMLDGEPIVLFECKMIGTDLDRITPSQLYRYFSVTDARFSVLTDGIHYQFYSDLDKPNKMDPKPFLEFWINDISDRTAQELKKFSKEFFNVDDILCTANDLKYTKGIKRAFSEEWMNPSEEFVSLFISKVYDGRRTAALKEQFTHLTKAAFHEFVNEMFKRRLKTAMDSDSGVPASSSEMRPSEVIDDAVEENKDLQIETTEEEIEGFHAVKAILRDAINPSRIFMRDTQSYCGVLLDDNNRKPICRLLFNSPTRKFLGLFDSQKNMTREPIESVDDIYRFADALKATVENYDNPQLVETVEISPPVEIAEPQ